MSKMATEVLLVKEECECQSDRSGYIGECRR